MLRHIPLPDSSFSFPFGIWFFWPRTCQGYQCLLHHPSLLFDLCWCSSSFALWHVVLCSLPFPLSSLFSLLCLDFLTKDCQGFLLLVSLSFPPDCTFLAAVYQFVGSVFCLFLLFRVKVLELPGQRRVRSFNACPFPPFFVCCFVLCWCPWFCFVFWSFLVAFCFGGLAWAFLLFVDFALSILTEVLESSDQRRVRILNTSPPSPILPLHPDQLRRNCTV